MRIPRPWERWRPGCCIHPGRLPCGPSALFNIGDLTLSLYESELATGLLPNKITDLSSLSNSGEARSPILNRAVLGSSPDSIPPHFVTVFKSVVPSTRLFKSEPSHTCTLVVDFGDLITKIYQSRRRCWCRAPVTDWPQVSRNSDMPPPERRALEGRSGVCRIKLFHLLSEALKIY